MFEKLGKLFQFGKLNQLLADENVVAFAGITEHPAGNECEFDIYVSVNNVMNLVWLSATTTNEKLAEMFPLCQLGRHLKFLRMKKQVQWGLGMISKRSVLKGCLYSLWSVNLVLLKL